VWKERADLLMSVPGVGPTLSATLLAELPELEYLETAGGSPRWWGWRLSTGIPAPCAEYARCGAAARG
jgi:hypothetical protein